jgi:thiamine-phosphate pyrophosphorylase
MQFSFTAAAERALVYASGWVSRAGHDELDVQALLVGLLREPECRAATMLAKHAVDIPAVRRQWPTLAPRQPSPIPYRGGDSNVSPHGGYSRQGRFSTDVECSIQAACDRLAFLPQPLELATEHLLLGLVAADHEVSAWLRQRGIDPNAIETEIHTIYGYRPEPLDYREERGEGREERGEGRGERDEEDECLAADGTSAPEPQIIGPSVAKQTALRVLDAAANRAREGLRVVEDCVRFVFDDRNLTGLCKQLRHDLTAALSRIPADNLLAARETQADVGTSLSTPSELRRDDVAGILRANFARLQEALRSLEEFDKLLDGRTDVFEQLRYRAYTLERAVEITRSSRQRLTSARLYVLLDGRQSPEEFERLARSLVEAGVHVIQLRDKRLGDRELLVRARLLRTLTQGTATLFVMNDRPDLAALARADGVHLGQNELSVKDARSIVGPEALLGVSTHNIEQARQAVLDGANYIGVGPVFPSETKQFERFPGVELLRAVAAEIGLPAFAIGGIMRENLPEVLAAGFTRIAVSAAIASADEPGQAARELLAILEKHAAAR